MLARIKGGKRITTGNIDSTGIKSGGEISKFYKLFGTNSIQISSSNVSSDTIILPAGKTFKLTAYLKFSIHNGNGANVQFKFYDRTNSEFIGLQSFTEHWSSATNHSYVPAVAYVTTGASSVQIGIYGWYIDYSGTVNYIDTSADITRIEVEEIR